MAIKVSVIIPNYNGKEYLKDCVDSLFKQSVRSFEVIIVDDASADDAVDELMREYPANTGLPCVRYIKHIENKGFAASVNDGIAAARAEYVLLLNNDTVADRGFVEDMWRDIRRSEDIFSVSAKMLNMHEPSKMDDAGDFFCALGWAFSDARDKDAEAYNKHREVFSACGGAAIYRKDALLELGGFDEAHFAYLEDVDLGYRAKLQGYRNIYSPKAEVLHAGSGSSGSRYNEFKLRLTVRNQVYLLFKNMPLWQWIVNFLPLLAGWMIKLIFFARKGMGGAYIKAFAEGIRLCAANKDKRVDHQSIPLSRQLKTEGELIINTIRRIL